MRCDEAVQLSGTQPRSAKKIAAESAVTGAGDRPRPEAKVVNFSKVDDFSPRVNCLRRQAAAMIAIRVR